MRLPFSKSKKLGTAAVGSAAVKNVSVQASEQLKGRISALTGIANKQQQDFVVYEFGDTIPYYAPEINDIGATFIINGDGSIDYDNRLNYGGIVDTRLNAQMVGGIAISLIPANEKGRVSLDGIGVGMMTIYFGYMIILTDNSNIYVRGSP